MSVVFFNGSFIEEEEAKIGASSNAALFGEGVFTSTIVKDRKILFLEQHLERLREHANFIGITPININETDIYQLIYINKFQNGSFRLRITLFSKSTEPPANRSKSDRMDGLCDHLITLKPMSEQVKPSLKLCVYPEKIYTPLAKVKTLNYLNRFFVKNYALDKGFDDSLVLGSDSLILEASFSNIFWVKDKDFFFPDDNLPFFKGIVLTHIIEEMKNRGYQTKPGRYQISDIPENANVYLCNSVKQIMNVSQIEDNIYPVRPINLNFL